MHTNHQFFNRFTHMYTFRKHVDKYNIPRKNNSLFNAKFFVHRLHTRPANNPILTVARPISQP